MKRKFCPARKNPFATEHLQKIRYQFADESIDQLLKKFETLGKRAAIVAPEGHGKTTLQKELAALLPNCQTHWIKLRQGDRRIPKALLKDVFLRANANDIICVDGAEQLSWWNWKMFLRKLEKMQGCLITSHRKGLLPTLVECKTSLSLLINLVTQLTTPPNSKQAAELKKIFENHRGDIRKCLRELYDRCSEGEWRTGVQSH